MCLCMFDLALKDFVHPGKVHAWAVKKVYLRGFIRLVLHVRTFLSGM